MPRRLSASTVSNVDELRRTEAGDIAVRRRAARVAAAGEQTESAPEGHGAACDSEALAAEKAAPASSDRGEPPPKNLVGLALSGGGVRAACVGVGLLQALEKSGLMRFVDYLSTVSGGGYVGSCYSSSLVRGQASGSLPPAVFAEADKSKVQRGCAPAGQPPRVMRLIFGGKYLNRPWEAANKYLIGLFLNNIALLSGLIALAAFVALLWRSLDYPAVRDFLKLAGLDYDVYAAYLPFAFLLACWLAAWMLSYFRNSNAGEAPGRWAQRFLYFAIAAFLIGSTLLLVNGENTLGFYQNLFGDGRKEAPTGAMTKWLLTALGATLLPLLQPRQLIQRGLRPSGLWDRLLFRTTCTAMLVGVPLAAVGILGKENLSATAIDDGDKVRAGDVQSWPAFCALIGATDHELSASEERALEEWEQKAAKGGAPAGARTPQVARKDLARRAHEIVTRLKQQSELQADLRSYGLFGRIYLIAGWWTAQKNSARDLWRLQRDLSRRQEELCVRFSERLLTPTDFSSEIISDRSWSASPAARASIGAAILPRKPPDVEAIEAAAAKRKLQLGEFAFSEDLQEILRDAKWSRMTEWRVVDSKELNLRLLREWRPECFYDYHKIYRWIVIGPDQWLRLKIFAAALAVFAIGLSINLNGASLHRFYRNRLAYAYLETPADARPDINLSGMSTTEHGGPYHILNATIDLARPRFLDQVDQESRDATCDRRLLQTFIFSRRYCGSAVTGWAETAGYEDYLRDNISLADAMALSGAAADSLMYNSLPLTVMMTALNLNLGQWLPNPKYGKPRCNPRLLPLAWDWRRAAADSTYCFISDGGFTDNLGVVTLLERRCKLIIALDAGCDPKHECADLSQVIRTARVHHGIEIVKLHPDDKGAELDLAPLALDAEGNTQRHFVAAKIEYPERGETGLLIYVKSSLTGDESLDLLEYRGRRTGFPHDDTSDQFYDPQRVESYRQLGYHMGRKLCGRMRDCIRREGDVASLDFLELERRLRLPRVARRTPTRKTAEQRPQRSDQSSHAAGREPISLAPSPHGDAKPEVASRVLTGPTGAGEEGRTKGATQQPGAPSSRKRKTRRRPR